jgi:endogenous inhibitor of DNA gyrase (YacG/DUF329 family)
MTHYHPAQHTGECVHCHRRLTGKQERYCSAACRQATYRAGKRTGPPVLRICALCGGDFEPVRPRQKFCTYDMAGFDDEAGFLCINLQEDLWELEEDAKAARESAVCAHCGKSAGWTGRGRPKKYCSGRCKVADFRAAKRAAAQEHVSEPL